MTQSIPVMQPLWEVPPDLTVQAAKEPPRLDHQTGRTLVPRTRPVLHSVTLGAARLAWCDQRAARHAVESWHYSGSLPFGKCLEIGVWEEDRFIGCVQFGLGSNPRIGLPWGLDSHQVCELQRVALTTHVTPTSQIVAAAVRMLRAHSPGMQLIVSYADPQQGHRGAIYQAMNWLYVGTSRPQAQLVIDGVPMHKKTAFSAFGTASTKTLQARGIDAVRGPIEWKHKYVLPLHRAMSKRLAAHALPYPKCPAVYLS